MTEIARLDPARGRTADDGVATYSAYSAAELPELPSASQVPRSTYTAISSSAVWPAGASSLAATEAVPGWAVASAALTPILLVGGWLVAGAFQPSSYSPLQQTVSMLAGQTGTDSWVMTGAFFLVGASQLATAAGLREVGRPARLLLVVAGLCTLGVATSPEPAAGPTPLHLAFAVSCVLSTAIWPLFVARRDPAPSWILSVHGCAAVTACYAALSGWVLFASFGGGDLGLAERLTSALLGLFPLIVAISLRQAARQGARSASS